MKIKIILICFCLLAIVSCSKKSLSTESTTKYSESKTQTILDATVYDGELQSPKYNSVDMSDYISYYFDSEKGDDSNDGLTEGNAKKSLTEASSLITTCKYNTKMVIKLKGTFIENFDVKASSFSEKSPLIITSYGDDRAIIDGNGYNSAVTMTGSNIRFLNIEVTNKKGRIGICFESVGPCKNIVISKCYIHNVNWNWTLQEDELSMASHLDDLTVDGSKLVDPNMVYETGGIIFTTSQETPSWIENLWVENNIIEKVSRSGVFLTSFWINKSGVSWGKNHYYDDDHGYYPAKNVNYIGNQLNITGGDGLVMIGVTGGFFEKNISYNANFLGRSANVGMWPISCKNIVIQYNEAAFCHLANGGVDGEGFDIDIGCENVVFQYNYSHDNDGPGILLCNVGTPRIKYDIDGNVVKENGRVVYIDERANWNNAIIRNNVFYNNGLRPNHPTLMHVAGSCFDVNFENNTVIYSNRSNQTLMTIAMWDEKYLMANDFSFKNNIFYSPVKNDASVDLSFMGEELMVLNNNYYNLSNELYDTLADSKAQCFDPMFDSLSESSAEDRFTPSNALVNSCGLRLPRKNEFDFYGKSTKSIYYIGANCKQ